MNSLYSKMGEKTGLPAFLGIEPVPTHRSGGIQVAGEGLGVRAAIQRSQSTFQGHSRGAGTYVTRNDVGPLDTERVKLGLQNAGVVFRNP